VFLSGCVVYGVWEHSPHDIRAVRAHAVPVSGVAVLELELQVHHALVDDPVVGKCFMVRHELGKTRCVLIG
jgi:hypothetical protein